MNKLLTNILLPDIVYMYIHYMGPFHFPVIVAMLILEP